jgi:hypothetical protein
MENLIGLTLSVLCVSFPFICYKVIYYFTTTRYERIAQRYESQKLKAHKKNLEARRAQRRRQVALQESQARAKAIGHETHYGLARDRLVP